MPNLLVLEIQNARSSSIFAQKDRPGEHRHEPHLTQSHVVGVAGEREISRSSHVLVGLWQSDTVLIEDASQKDCGSWVICKTNELRKFDSNSDCRFLLSAM